MARCAWIDYGVTSMLVAAGLSLPLPAGAQTADATRVWISARFLTNLDGSWSQRQVYRTPGLGLAIGLDRERVGVEVAADWPEPHVANEFREEFDPRAGRLRTSSEQSRRSRSWTGLLAVHVRRHSRIRATATAGLTMVAHTSTLSGYQERLGPGGDVRQRTNFADGGTYQWLGISCGVRTPILITRHLSVVPEVQGALFLLSETGSWILRPALGVRWTF